MTRGVFAERFHKVREGRKRGVVVHNIRSLALWE
jgi:hypothetical protein